VKSIVVHHVKYLPKELAQGILYVSREYAVAGHLCGCGCGAKVVTPLSPVEWTYLERNGRPTLDPSIGNWQLPCRSHYFIADGQIHFAGQWSDEQITAGRSDEVRRRQVHYEAMDRNRGFWHRLVHWIYKLLGLRK
jgi:Family of unknown function (DUF6527)